jgi:glycerophosphoryl diester phosphodiesterase
MELYKTVNKIVWEIKSPAVVKTVRNMRYFVSSIFRFLDYLFFKRTKYNVLFNAHALGAWRGHVYTNSREAFIQSYKKGFRIFEVDIANTRDNEFVAIHTWHKSSYDNLELQFNGKNSILTKDEYLSQKLLSRTTTGATPLALDDIFSLMREHSDTIVMFDLWPLVTGIYERTPTCHISEENICNFIASFQDSEIAKRSIVEVYNPFDALSIKKMGFQNAQIWIFDSSERFENFKTIENYISFLNKNNIDIVSVSANNVRRFPDEIGKLKSAGIIVFSPGWNRYRHIQFAEKIGVDVITTDFLLPGINQDIRKIRRI